MFNALNYPLLVLVVSLSILWISTWGGAWFRARRRDQADASRDDLAFILGGALTLLGLIIGFTFSMAVGRYDQRKNYEEAEANAIGTEYVRTDLLPAADAARVRALLRDYLDQRILSYTTRNEPRRRQIDAQTARLQTEMWAAVVAVAARQLTPVTSLYLAGMNDVLNSQGYTQAAFWNRIPTAAWGLMVTIAICCNFLFGYRLRSKAGAKLLVVLPIVISIAFMLVADIDTPRHGIIRVSPQNLISLAESLRAQ
jgi:hypothetical protein